MICEEVTCLARTVGRKGGCADGKGSVWRQGRERGKVVLVVHWLSYKPSCHVHISKAGPAPIPYLPTPYTTNLTQTYPGRPCPALSVLAGPT